ncbi:MAG: TaqI-like C-terminal specificity domain-containing protein [Thiotrichaceae bacterium]|nr:TaqI-like C-terminal specificity domain-containing protein [Thiotrichaceae bacterium]
MFQKSVLQKHLQRLDSKLLEQAFLRFKQVYSSKRIEQIKSLKEEEYQAGFLRDIFVQVFAYILNPDQDFNLQLEFKNPDNNKKVDAVILRDKKAIAVIELKSTKTKDLDVVTEQAFSYKNHQQGCLYVITSNFQKLRFYIEYANEYAEFDLFNLKKSDFDILYLLLHSQYLLQDLPLILKTETKQHEKQISKQFYQDYSKFKQAIFNQFCKHNSQADTLVLFQKSQKFFDRLLFVLFAEDMGLLEPNLAQNEIEHWQHLVDLGVSISLYTRFNQFFAYLDTGFKSNVYDIPKYNGGLFAPDAILNQLMVDDAVLQEWIPKLAKYNFSSELDVNILGHVFEHSLNELEEIKAKIEGNTVNKKATKRKKDGIFYTPQYITNYIVEQTLGILCLEKRNEFNLVNIEFNNSHWTKTGNLSKKGKELFKKLDSYKNWLFDLKILDPACGSGAFLNRALNFLIAEHQKIDNIVTELTGSKITLDTDKIILEKNIYGVDINEESIEITKLSLWLRTAKKHRELSHLNNNIKCGNSLIDDVKIAGNKAFNWKQEFPKIMQNGGFDVIIGNPPYGAKLDNKVWLKQRFKQTSFGTIDSYKYFLQQGTELLKNAGISAYIIPDSYLKKEYFADLRNYLAQHFNKIKNIQLGDGIFQGVNLPTAIILLAEKHAAIEHQQFENIAQCYLSEKDLIHQQFTCSVSQTGDIIKKLINHDNTTHLIDLYHQVMGVKVYQKGKGKPAQTGVEKQQDLFVSANPSPEYNYPYISQGIARYSYDERKIQFIKYGAWLAEPREQAIFDKPKLIIREVINPRIFATYIEQAAVIKNIAAVIVNKNSDYSLKYLLALLNSKLLTFYIKSQSPKQQNKSYPSFTSKLIKTIPIIAASSSQQQPFIEKTQKILLLHKMLQNKKIKFMRRLCDNFNIPKITKKITCFYEFEFKILLDELKKQKIELNLKQQDEWEIYFNEYKKDINQLQTDIKTTDYHIEQMVYQLYDLTEDEIKIIEQEVE